MLWPSSGSTYITMENSVQTTLRLRALACGPVWICQSFLKGSTLGESERVGERKQNKERERERGGSERKTWVRGFGKESAVNCEGLLQLIYFEKNLPQEEN